MEAPQASRLGELGLADSQCVRQHVDPEPAARNQVARPSDRLATGPALEHASRRRRHSTVPCLSVPLGPPDDLVCPDDHVDWLMTRMHQARYHLLVLGYSALDPEVLT